MVTKKDILERPSEYDGKEIFLEDIRIVPNSVIKYNDIIDDGYCRPSFYCLLELDEDSGLVLPFGIKNHYVQEVRPTTYHIMLKASEGKSVSARGLFGSMVIDIRDLGDIIAEVPENVDCIHDQGLRLSQKAESISASIDRNIRRELVDPDKISLDNHYYMEGYIIPTFRLLSKQIK